MKTDIKKDILEMGFRLFSKYGYANVTMRNIADALNMSVGNLTYHYKKKEDIIEAILIGKSENFSVPPVPTTLQELNDFFIRSVESQKNNDNFFRFHDQLAKISPKVYALQVEAIGRRKELLKASFEILKENGFLREEEILGQYNALIDIINMIKIYWLPSQKLFTSSPISCQWSILYPQLTEKGKNIYQKEIQRNIENDI